MREKATSKSRVGSRRTGGASGGADAGTRPALDMGPLDDLLGYLLRRAQLAVFEDFIKAFAPLRLRPAQFSALIVIDRNPGRSQAEIAAALGIARPNFVAMMDELERRGLAERTSSKTDRRSHALVLTVAGRRLLKRALDVVAKHETRVSRGLGAAERASLVRLLRRFP
jgi:DNA-binding MarR family transcriptional regulator